MCLRVREVCTSLQDVSVHFKGMRNHVHNKSVCSTLVYVRCLQMCYTQSPTVYSIFFFRQHHWRSQDFSTGGGGVKAQISKGG